MVTEGGHAGGEPTERWALRVAAALVLVELVALLMASGWEALAAVTRDLADPVTAWVAVVLGVLAAAGLLLVARGLLRRRRWARSPALVTQLLLLPVAISLLQSGQAALGVPLLAVTVVTAAVLLSPPISRALDEAR